MVIRSPDMEYYFLYPHIATGGLFLLDDTHIPTIGRMFDILKADDTFKLIEVLDNMAASSVGPRLLLTIPSVTGGGSRAIMRRITVRCLADLR